MTFNSLQYAAFLPAVLLLYWRLGHRRQNVLLLVASYLFYAAYDWRFLGLMLVSTGTDYTVGKLLARTEAARRRKQVFTVSLVINLGILAVFKYAGFFSESFDRLLRRVGLEADIPTLRVLLPIGISFYIGCGGTGAGNRFTRWSRTAVPNTVGVPR